MAVGGDSITLTSTTDPLEAVQEALGIEQTHAAKDEPVEKPAAEAAAAETTEEPAAKAAAAPAAKEEAPAVTDDDDDDDEGEADDDDDDEDAAIEVQAHKRARPGSKAQKRISDLIRERNTLADAASKTAGELEALRQRVEADRAAATAAKPGADPATEDPKPSPDTFGTYEEFSDALVQWGVRNYARDAVSKELEARARLAQRHQYGQIMENAAAQYAERLVAAQTKYDDFDRVIQRPDIKISRTMQEGMLTSDMGPEIAYYLGKNPQECQKLFSLGDSAVANRAFGVLEEKIRRTVEVDTPAEAADEKPAKAKKAKAAPAEEKPASAAAAASVAAADTRTPAEVAAEIEAKNGTGGARSATTQRATALPDPISPSGGGSAANTVPMDQMDFQAYKTARINQIRERQGLR